MKHLLQRDKHQPCLQFHRYDQRGGTSLEMEDQPEGICERRHTINVEPAFEQTLERINELIARIKRTREKRKITNGDPIWNKGLRLTQAGMTSNKRWRLPSNNWILCLLY